MKDDGGIGPSYVSDIIITTYMSSISINFIQSSWVDKMITRIRNVFKRANKKIRDSGEITPSDVPPAKKKKDAKQTLLMRYPIKN